MCLGDPATLFELLALFDCLCNPHALTKVTIFSLSSQTVKRASSSLLLHCEIDVSNNKVNVLLNDTHAVKSTYALTNATIG